MQRGNLDNEQSFRIENLQTGERRDYSLHQRGQRVGLYLIIPDDPNADYGAFLTRYSQTSSGRFAFAFPLASRKGSCDSGRLPASIMANASNWGEIGNPTSSSVDIEIVLRNRAGALLKQQQKTLSPYSQTHVYLNTDLQSDSHRHLPSTLCKPNFE